MRVIFSTVFRADLEEACAHYSEISSKLGDDFKNRVQEAVQAVIRWQGGDHVGPHGFRCRKCRPFPYAVCYEIEGETLFVLGLVHERRHPDHLRHKLGFKE